MFLSCKLIQHIINIHLFKLTHSGIFLGENSLQGAEAGNPLKHQHMVPTEKDPLVCQWNQYGPDVFT
jgi:hypothetical protein